MPAKIVFSLPKKLRGRSSTKKDGEVLVNHGGEQSRSSFLTQLSPPPPQQQTNPRNGKLNSAPSGSRRKSNTAPSSPVKESSKSNSRRKAETETAVAAAPPAAAAVPGNNLVPVKSQTSSEAKEEEVGEVNSDKSKIFSTSCFIHSTNRHDDDDDNQFFFPSFDMKIDNELMWMDDGDNLQQHQQSNQTYTTCSNSISGSQYDGHEDSDDDGDDEKPHSIAVPCSGLFTEEESADPPAILLDLDEDESMFDHHQFAAQEEEEEEKGKKREKSGNNMPMFFMQNDDHEGEAHRPHSKTPSKNEFWLSSSSSSSFFGLSSTSQTQSNDNDEESYNYNPSWEHSRMNNHRRVVSPSPSPSSKIQITPTTSSTSTAAASTSEIAAPLQISTKQKSCAEKEDLAAWGEIISAIKKSPTESMSDSRNNNANIHGEDVFADSFFNNEFSSSIHANDQEEHNKNHNNNNRDEDEFVATTAIENRSVGSDDDIFFSNNHASWSNTVATSHHNEKHKGTEQESETNFEHITASLGEDVEDSTSLLDTLFDYSLSNEDPPVVVEGEEEHGNIDSDLCRSDDGRGGDGGENEPHATVVAASGVETPDPPKEKSLGHNTMKVHNDSVSISNHARAQHHLSKEHNQRQSHQPFHHQHQKEHLRRRRMRPSSLNGQHDNKLVDISTLGDDADIQFLLANLEATIGPRGVAPDMESLSGRSSVRSARSARSDHGHQHHHQHHHRDPPSKQFNDGRPFVSRRDSGSDSTGRQQYSPSGGASVDSRASRSSKASRKSYRSHQSTRSALTSMSKETRCVANDLFRLEAQLADQVERQQQGEEMMDDDVILKSSNSSGVVHVQLASSEEGVTSSSSGEHDISTHSQPLGATPAPRPNTHFELIAPPGKLGILLSNVKPSTNELSAAGGVLKNKYNKTVNTGPTHVSSVRSTSVLAGRVHVGDIFLSIDGEDVTRMNSLEITNIMARKSDSPRVLRLQPLVNSTVAQWQEWI